MKVFLDEFFFCNLDESVPTVAGQPPRARAPLPERSNWRNISSVVISGPPEEELRLDHQA